MRSPRDEVGDASRPLFCSKVFNVLFFSVPRWGGGRWAYTLLQTLPFYRHYRGVSDTILLPLSSRTVTD